MTDRYIEAADLSSAWVETAALVLGLPQKAGVHVVVRISDPTTEDRRIRALIDALLAELGKPPVETVRNTIFPAAIAARFPEPDALAAHYREKYPVIRRFPKNGHGTYFGRMVELPVGGAESVDQLSNLVAMLRSERAKSKGVLSSHYEINIGMAGIDVNLYVSARDRTRRFGFPCLSLCSFHVGNDRLHLAAHYRNQYLIERAYGNFVGLGELLAYIAGATGFGVGELLVVAGHASIDAAGKTRLRRLLDDARDATAQGEAGETSAGAPRGRPRSSARRRSRR